MAYIRKKADNNDKTLKLRIPLTDASGKKFFSGKKDAMMEQSVNEKNMDGKKINPPRREAVSV